MKTAPLLTQRGFVHALTATLLVVAAASWSAPLSAQKGPAKSAEKKNASAPSLVGTWVGTATVPLADSAIVVPVSYSFTQVADSIGGTAMVPGQGMGPISNVVRTGKRIQFRVTAPENKLLEHDGTFGDDGAIEGMVNYQDKPVARFKIAIKK